MTGRRRPSIEDREPAVDLFDDPPWPRYLEVQPWRRIRHVAFVAFVALLGLLGLLGVLAAMALIGLVAMFFSGFDLNIGPVDVPPPSSYGIDLALSADGSVAYVTEPNTNRLLVLDTATGKLVASVAVGDDPSGLAVSPDGNQVWVVNSTLSSALGSTTGSSTASSTAGSSTTGSSTTGSAPGTPPTSVAGTGSVSVVSTWSNQVLGTIPVGTGPIAVAFSPDGRWAFVTDNGALAPGAVTVINTATLAVVWSLAPTPSDALMGLAGPNPTSVAVTPDGRQVWVSEVNDFLDLSPSTTPDSVSVFDAALGSETATIPVGAGPFFMVLSPDGRHAFVADKLSCDVKEIDTATLDVVGTIRWPSSQGCPFGLAPAGDDNVVYTVTGSDHSFDQSHAGDVFGSVDFSTGEAHIDSNVGGDPVTLALSPDGATAYVVDADRPVIDVVDTANGSVRKTLPIPD